jgi:hypothetical protein
MEPREKQELHSQAHGGSDQLPENSEKSYYSAQFDCMIFMTLQIDMVNNCWTARFPLNIIKNKKQASAICRNFHPLK